MPVTREEVVTKAKELGLTLSDKEIDALVTLGRLPEKAAGSPPGGGDDDDPEEEKDLTEGMRKRLAKEREKRNAKQRELDDALAKVRQFEASNTEAQRQQSEKKGEYEKLLGEVRNQRIELDNQGKAIKDRVKSMTIETGVKAALLQAGVPADRLPKAVKLFDLVKVGFEWSDEKTLAGELDEEALKGLVDEFKKGNTFLFEEPGDESNSGGFKPRKPGMTPKKGSKEEEEKNAYLERRFPALKTF